MDSDNQETRFDMIKQQQKPDETLEFPRLRRRRHPKDPFAVAVVLVMLSSTIIQQTILVDVIHVKGYSLSSSSLASQLTRFPPLSSLLRRQLRPQQQPSSGIVARRIKPTIDTTARLCTSTSSLWTSLDDNIDNGDSEVTISSNNSQTSIRSTTTTPLEPLAESIMNDMNNNNNTSSADVTTSVSSSSESEQIDTQQQLQEVEAGALPSYRRLIVFTATTILIWLSEPLLSLVDTTIVGLTSNAKTAVIQIAALGPATTLYDSAIYMTYFLAIATTNQLAPKLAKKEYKALRQSTSHLMGLAVLFGTVVSLVTFGLGKSIIGQMVGTSIADPTIVPLATNYAKIRAAVAPLCVVDFVAQSFCLTILDTKTPALAVAVASIVNIVGDLILSPIWGIQGAAVATAMATTTSCLILVRKVRKVVSGWKQKQDIQETKQEYLSSASFDKDASTATDAVMSAETEKVDIPFISLPNKKAMVDLMKLAGPIFFVMMSKIACYSVLTVRATSFGVLPLATHNIMMRVFFFFACFGDSLSQAAQSFYPQVAKQVHGKLFKRLFYLSAAVGISNHQTSQLILKHFGRFLTKDSNIIEMMGQYSPLVGMAVLLHPFIMLLEGTVLAKRDLVFMVAMYVATGLLHFGHVFSPAAASFLGLWRCLFVFQFIRLIQFAVRVWDTSRREKNDTVAPSSV